MSFWPTSTTRCQINNYLINRMKDRRTQGQTLPRARSLWVVWKEILLSWEKTASDKWFEHGSEAQELASTQSMKWLRRVTICVRCYGEDWCLVGLLCLTSTPRPVHYALLRKKSSMHCTHHTLVCLCVCFSPAHRSLWTQIHMVDSSIPSIGHGSYLLLRVWL